MAVIILVGKKASGIGSIEKELAKKGYNRIKKYTTAPLKENQVDDPNFYHISDIEFDEKQINGDFAVQIGQVGKRTGIDKASLAGDSVMIVDSKELSKINEFKSKNKNYELYTVYIDCDYDQRYRMLSKGNKSSSQIRRDMLDDLENYATAKAETNITIKNNNVSNSVNEILSRVNESHSKAKAQSCTKQETGILKVLDKLENILNKKLNKSKRKEAESHGI